MLLSGTEVFTAEDLSDLSDLVGTTWMSAVDLDWSVPAGTLEWSCLATADHGRSVGRPTRGLGPRAASQLMK
ncbi:MAG TPA: hypothetical protein PK020_21800 [Ilumatobacteraceae bacterium]|nr:hypothetical protein [Ilumatobacteraceae bacterium]